MGKKPALVDILLRFRDGSQKGDFLVHITEIRILGQALDGMEHPLFYAQQWHGITLHGDREVRKVAAEQGGVVGKVDAASVVPGFRHVDCHDSWETCRPARSNFRPC